MATQITINGTRKEADGTAASGTVEAKLSHELFDTDGNIVATKDTISTTLDASGDWTLTLYATNDDDTTPTGAYYAFTFRDADGRVVSQYRAEVDNSSTPARFEDLIEVTSSNVSAIGSWINGGSDAAELGSGNATDGYVLTADGTGGTAWEAQTGGGGGVSDGDKGDITVSGGGATWTIDAGAVDASKVAADVATQAELDAEAALARNADNLTSGTVADARIASTIARDSEVTSAISTHSGDTDPHGDRAYADGLASNYATAAQGATADSALQPEDVLDEDDFASNSATQPPSQQSTKAYVDTEIAALPEAGYGISTARTGFLDVQAIEEEDFTSTGTLTKPDGTRYIRILARAAGGGGAGGSRNAEGNNRYGGGGGAAGAYLDVIVDASIIPDGGDVTIGAAGSGGAGATTNTWGGAGTNGGDIVIETTGTDITVPGGAGASHAGGFTPGIGGRNTEGVGGNATIFTTPNSPGLYSLLATGQAGGGAAGSSRTSANSNIVAGQGGGNGSAAGGPTTTSGDADPGGDGVAGTLDGGGGGGGSGPFANNTYGSGNGGDGGFPGGGGGGGSFGNADAAGGDTNGGDGGDGGAGYVRLIYFR